MNRYGHCDAKVLLHYAANSGVRRTISEILEEWLHQHSVFTRLILPAIQLQRVRRQAGTPDCSVVSTPADNELSERSSSKLPTIGSRPSFTTSGRATASALYILGGHEETLLALIADFVGVIRGRQLRNARIAIALLAPAKSPGSKETARSTPSPPNGNFKDDLGEWCLFSFDY
jgi:hypothetical protein